MSVTSTRTITVDFSGDITVSVIQSALENEISPAMEVLQSLVMGANTITAPVVSGLVVTALTIIPPAGNVIGLTLKGVTGDSGISLHLTDPTSIALDPSFISLVIEAASAVVGIRFIWS